MTEPTLSITDFITRWQQSSASERANCQSFLNELCEVLGVPKPQPAQNNSEADAYVYERAVTFHHTERQQTITTTGWIDFYKRGCFVLEAKQGSLRDGGNEGRGDGATLFEGIGKGKSRKKGTAVRGTKAWDDAMVRARGQAEQVRAVRSSLTDEAVTADQLAKRFVRGRAEQVESLLETLVSLGLAREVEAGKFAA